MRKGTYKAYKKRHDADVKAGRAKGPALSRRAWQSYHDHHDASHGEGSHQKAQYAAENSGDYATAKGRSEAQQQAHWNASDAHAEVHEHLTEKKDGHHALRPAHTHHDVHDMMNKHKLEEDDAKELKNFKKSKEGGGNKVSPAELKRMFEANCDPKTKERMKDMPIDDFMKMYAAILDDEEPGAAKAASLRDRTIRLAHENPELRKHLLPLLKA